MAEVEEFDYSGSNLSGQLAESDQRVPVLGARGEVVSKEIKQINDTTVETQFRLNPKSMEWLVDLGGPSTEWVPFAKIKDVRYAAMARPTPSKIQSRGS